jgi:hypothetical protein
VLDRYVEAELGGRDAGARFHGVGVHLTICPACRTEHDGLLALIELDEAVELLMLPVGDVTRRTSTRRSRRIEAV